VTEFSLEIATREARANKIKILKQV